MTPRTKKRITDLMRNQVAGVRPTAKVLNQSPAFIANGKTVGATTVRRFVRSTDWGKIAYKERKMEHEHIQPVRPSK